MTRLGQILDYLVRLGLWADHKGYVLNDSAFADRMGPSRALKSSSRPSMQAKLRRMSVSRDPMGTDYQFKGNVTFPVQMVEVYPDKIV